MLLAQERLGVRVAADTDDRAGARAGVAVGAIGAVVGPERDREMSLVLARDSCAAGRRSSLRAGLERRGSRGSRAGDHASGCGTADSPWETALAWGRSDRRSGAGDWCGARSLFGGKQSTRSVGCRRARSWSLRGRRCIRSARACRRAVSASCGALRTASPRSNRRRCGSGRSPGRGGRGVGRRGSCGSRGPGSTRPGGTRGRRAEHGGRATESRSSRDRTGCSSHDESSANVGRVHVALHTLGSMRRCRLRLSAPAGSVIAARPAEIQHASSPLNAPSFAARCVMA